MGSHTPGIPDHFGEKRRTTDWDSLVTLVRETWPTAFCEGSAFLEKSWFVGGYDHLVAVSWPVGGRKSLDEHAGYYVRILPPDPGDSTPRKADTQV